MELLNKTFGRLTISKIAEKKSGHQYVDCQCSCGNTTHTRLDSLERGWTQSCGCLQKEKASLTGKKSKLPIGVSPANTLYCDYRKSAKKRGISFQLAKEMFLQLVKKPCFYCGDIPQLVKKNQWIPEDFFIYNGIDRINNKRGYSVNNCIPCCEFCNIAKSDWTQKAFFEKVKKICQKHKL